MLLPEPFGPTIVTISPASSARSTPVEHPVPAEGHADAPGLDRARVTPAGLAAAGAEPLGLHHGPLDARSRPPPPRPRARRRGRGSGVSATRRQTRQMRKPALCAASAWVQAAKAAEPLDPVREAVRHQEVERPVDHRRLAAEPRRGQLVEDLVGGHRPVRGEQRLQHEGARRGQPQPPLGADAPRPPPAPARGSARWSCGRKASGSGALDAGICYFITDCRKWPRS